MATSMNAYERLYNNMKTRFTVVNGESECSLGEYMLIKAGKKKESSALPVANATLRQPSAVVSFVNYINDRLMVKEAPASLNSATEESGTYMSISEDAVPEDIEYEIRAN